MNEVIALIKEVGFPIAVAAYVLVRLNGKLDRLTTAIYSLRSTIQTHLSHDDVKTIIESYLHLDEPRDSHDPSC